MNRFVCKALQSGYSKPAGVTYCITCLCRLQTTSLTVSNQQLLQQINAASEAGAAVLAAQLVAQAYINSTADTNTSVNAASHYIGLQQSKVIGGLLLHMVRSWLLHWSWCCQSTLALWLLLQVHRKDASSASSSKVLCRNVHGTPQQCNLEPAAASLQYNIGNMSKSASGFGQDPAFFM